MGSVRPGMLLRVGAQWAWSACTLLVCCLPAVAARDPRVVERSAIVDADQDRVNDHFQARLVAGEYARVGPPERQVADVIVALDHPPNAGDVEALTAAGAEVIEAWSDLVYAVHIAAPATSLHRISRLPGVALVEENVPVRAHLYLSTRQARGRQVWSAPYYLVGSPDHNIAVLDTGIDDSHPDFVGPSGSTIIDWRDEIGAAKATPGDEYAEPWDAFGHGSHVAGIVAGLGTSAGITTGVGTLPIGSFSIFGYDGGSSCWCTRSYFPVDSTGASGYSTITSRLKWLDTSPRKGLIYITQRNSAGTQLSLSSRYNDESQPLVTTYASLPQGTRNYAYYSYGYRNYVGWAYYWLQSSSPMTAVGDGYALLTGMAPGANLIGVKVLDDLGDSDEAIVINGLSWVVANKVADRIAVVNMSIGWDYVNATFDAAANNAVAAGIAVCISAGNGRGSTSPALPYVYSPGSASKAITVAAISELGKITSYSSYGNTGNAKPDVAAPGGSSVTHRGIASVDSNDGDFFDLSFDSTFLHADGFANDYASHSGTSMACPHVAGAAALLAEVMDEAGQWSWAESGSQLEDQALRVKMYLEMTATETSTTAEAVPNPALNRGAKDTSEGFGRINVDAAIEAVTMAHTLGATETATLGSQVTDKRCWARRVSLAAGAACTFSLTTPAGGDYDLYLYQDAYTNDGSTSLGSIGDPIIASKSTTAGAGVAETVNYTPSASGTYYVVVKWVSGSGSFSITSSVAELAVSVAPSTWPIGRVGPGDDPVTTWTESTPAYGGYFSATNEGTGSETLRIRVDDSAAWQVGISPGSEVFVMKWGQTQIQGVEPPYYIITKGGVDLGSAPLGSEESFAFDLQFTPPSDSEHWDEQSVVVTIEAHQP